MTGVHVTVPNAIQSGRNAILTCEYELENEDLYSVKWYKGKREFFRYTPKEIPSIKIFKLPGIRVDVSRFIIHVVYHVIHLFIELYFVIDFFRNFSYFLFLIFSISFSDDAVIGGVVKRQ